MPDLLGADPCITCEWGTGVCQGAARRWYEKNCLIHQRWDAKRTILEALKAGGVYWKHPDEPDGPTLPSFEDLGNFLRQVKVGWMVFIPEAQE